MTEVDYNREMANLELEHKQKCEKLMVKFAFENSSIKEGDKFTDHIGTIAVEKIKATSGGFGLPSCVYFGLELKKDGTPKKNGDKRWAYQSNQINQ